MILMGFNPDQQGEEEEGDPPAPSNSQSGPFICEERAKTKRRKQIHRTPGDEHGSLIQTEAGAGIQTLQMCRSFHRALKTSQTSDQLSPSPSSRVQAQYLRVFTGRNGPSVSPERSSLPPEMQPTEPPQQHRRAGTCRETDCEHRGEQVEGVSVRCSGV